MNDNLDPANIRLQEAMVQHISGQFKLQERADAHELIGLLIDHLMEANIRLGSMAIEQQRARELQLRFDALVLKYDDTADRLATLITVQTEQNKADPVIEEQP